jgi:hypothetical protein
MPLELHGNEGDKPERPVQSTAAEQIGSVPVDGELALIITVIFIMIMYVNIYPYIYIYIYICIYIYIYIYICS